ncbi:MAG: hypothetical protein JWP95_1200 [Actinotalea sp.]|nr:hypothetical protein [Actinotalea sp.]
MRRLAAALIATTLLLAGCSGDDAADDAAPDATEGAAEETTDGADAGPASAEDQATLDGVTVEGERGSEPTLDFEQPFVVSGVVSRVASEGDGAVLEAGQSLVIDYVTVSGDDGTALESTWERGQTDSITLGGNAPAFDDVLIGQQVGVRILFAGPGGEATEATDTSPASPAYPATITLIEVVDARTVPTRAEGEAVAPVEGLPVVTLAENGAPSIEVPAGAVEPTELVVQPLVVGSGPVVEQGQNVTVQYSGWLFDGTPFDSSWEGGAPFTTQIGTGSVIPGWDQGIIGQTVGSQVLLVIPPDLAYGAEDRGTIPANSTLIFVVDILDAS